MQRTDCEVATPAAKKLSNGVGQILGYDVGSKLGRSCMRIGALTFVSIGLASCNSTSMFDMQPQSSSIINTKTKFSALEYGVAASPRVSASMNPEKGGGREMIGKPYRVRGKWYTPREQPGYDKVGLASWYGPNFHGRLTANGEIYDQFHLSAAHPTFPLPSYARVTNKKNGSSVIVRVNDRGPFAHGRIIDLSNKAAELLDMKEDGVAAVRVQYIGRAPVNGDDTRYLMASYRPGNSRGEKGIASRVMMAMNAASSVLPGIKPAHAPLLPPSPSLASLPAGQASSNASTMDIPAGFTLPTIGPVLPIRPSFAPSFAMPVAANGDLLKTSTTRLHNNMGLAFWEDRGRKSGHSFKSAFAKSAFAKSVWSKSASVK